MPYFSNDDVIVNLSLNLTTKSYKNLGLEIIDADNILKRDPFVTYSKRFQLLVCGVLWLLILIGSKFRYVLYKYIFDQYRSRELTPINILTLVVSLVEHVSTVLLVLYGTLMVINGTSLQYITGGTCICSLLMYTIDFGRYYTFIGGFMISMYRILLIKNYRCVSGVER